MLSGGFLALKPKARALVKVVLAAYETSDVPTQTSTKSSRSRIKTLIRLLGDLTLAELTAEVLEAFKRIPWAARTDRPRAETRNRRARRAIG